MQKIEGLIRLSVRTAGANLIALLVVACTSDPTPRAPLHEANEEATAASAWRCPAQPGVAPDGVLVAKRIPGANSQRTEPGLYEGPVWRDGALYFSDFTFAQGFPSRIMRLRDAQMAVAIENSGSNGLALDHQGRLLAATHDRKAVSRLNTKTGERDIVVGKYAGAPFNSPNDLAISDDGSIYFTDPDYQRDAAPGGQQATRVYQYREGALAVVDESLQNPNGVSLSPDQQTLYVAGGSVLRAYTLENGKPSRGRDIAKLDGPDGMAVDCLGNLYVAEHGQQRLRVFSPAGEELALIKVDANVTNAAFGGPERKTLYITGAGAVWKLELEVAGLPY